MIGILIAMPEELRPYEPFITHTRTHFGKPFHEGRIGNKDVVISLCGIGKVNAAFSATLMVQIYAPSLLISTGLSGGLGILRQCDIVLAEKIVQHDVDTTALGDPRGMVSTVNKIFFETDAGILKKLAEALPEAKTGILASGDQFIADKELAASIAGEFGASACDMESGAVAQVAYLSGIPLAVIRCVSDAADDEAAKDFYAAANKLAEKTHNTVTTVIERL